MGRVRHPNLQNSSGHYLQGATVTAITNRDTEAAADAYTTEGGGTTVTYPLTSGAEGEVEAWVPTGAYETTFGEDTVDTPAVWEAVSGEDVSSMLTLDDIAGFPDYVVSPLDYGGDPTGGSDSTVALQAALDAAIAAKGTVHLGNGTAIWKYSSQLTGGDGIRITSGAAGGRGGANVQGKAKLRYTGSGSDDAILFGSPYNVELDHVHFDYTAGAAFTGHLVNFNGSSITGDTTNCHVHHCAFNEAVSGGAGLGADSLLRVNRGIFTEISECSFNGALNHLIMLEGFANDFTIRNCTFNDTDDNEGGQIYVACPVQALDIVGCSFEAAGAAGLYAITGSGGVLTHVYAMSIRSCWFGDNAAGGNPKWISGFNSVGDAGTLIVEGCYFGGQGTTGRAISAGPEGTNFLVMGCRFLNSAGGVFGRDDPAQGYSLTLIGNSISTGEWWQTGEGPNAGRFTKVDRRHQITAGHVVVSSQGGANEFKDYLDDVVAGDETTPGGAFIIGGTLAQADALPDMGTTAALLYRKNIGGNNYAVLQATTATDSEGMAIVAGATPAIKMNANGTGVAFNGSTPIAKPSVGAAATDPATTQTLANNLRTALINLGLAQT